MKIKTITSTLFLILMAAMLTVQCEPEGGEPPYEIIVGDDISGLTSMQLTHQMTVGWNLGNTLDSHWNGATPWITNPSPTDQEKLWGQPVTTKAMIDFIRKEGFNTVRVPVTWYIFTGPAPDYKIADAWMNRVQQVVDYVIDNGMYCILNTHHEELQGSQGWLKLEGTTSEINEMNNRLKKLWEQIAERFQDYDEYLIFEGLNEPRTLDQNYSTAQNDVLIGLLQTFVNTVRAAPGKNKDRHLMVSPFFASFGREPNDAQAKDFFNANGTLKVTDPRSGSNRLIVSVHYYEPWGFVDAPTDSEWYSATFDLSKGVVSGNINQVLTILDNNLIKKGIPVIMGETGAKRRDYNPSKPAEGKDNVPGHNAERAKWAKYYPGELKKLGIPVVIWDDGDGFRLFDRQNKKWFYPDIAAALVQASKTPIQK